MRRVRDVNGLCHGVKGGDVVNKREFALLADAIRTYYPKEKILPNEQAMALWFDLLQDISYELASVSLRRWAANNPWSPAISDLRQTAQEIKRIREEKELETRLLRGKLIEGS